MKSYTTLITADKTLTSQLLNISNKNYVSLLEQYIKEEVNKISSEKDTVENLAKVYGADLEHQITKLARGDAKLRIKLKAALKGKIQFNFGGKKYQIYS